MLRVVRDVGNHQMRAENGYSALDIWDKRIGFWHFKMDCGRNGSGGRQNKLDFAWAAGGWKGVDFKMQGKAVKQGIHFKIDKNGQGMRRARSQTQ
jgi:hypothetical protein